MKILVSFNGGLYRFCCGKFNAKGAYTLNLKEYLEAYIFYGFCPRCGKMVTEVYKRDFKNNYFPRREKGKKALRLYNEYKDKIAESILRSPVKHGTKFNMQFRYGDNREIYDCTGRIIAIRRYSVDFNGTRKLLSEIKVN